MRKNYLTGLTVLSSILVLTGCGGGNKKTESTEEETQKVIVKTTTAYSRDIDNIVDFTSTIEPFKSNDIAPTNPVRIEKILVDVGDNVRKGQLLVTMDPSTYNQINIQYVNARTDYERIKTVYEAGGVAKQSLDQAEAQMLVLKEQVDNLKVNTELYSPISGVVTERNYDPGDLYAGTPVLKVAEISTVKVIVALSEQYFTSLKVGTPAEIRVDLYPDKVFPGKVSRIHPAIDTGTRTFTVEISIPNQQNLLRPGMFSRTTINFGRMEGILVEDVAIQKQLGSSEKFVYVVKNGVAERRLVTTGRQIGSQVNVTSGVNDGDEIIMAGFSRLNNGTEIEIVND